MTRITDFIRKDLLRIKDSGLYRQRQLVLKKQTTLDFSSNDYLSLAQNKQLAKVYQQGFAKYPTGSGGSLFIAGYHQPHHDLEQAFAEFLNVDDCIIFTSGFAANLAVTALINYLQQDCLIDKAVHASIYDGLSLAKVAYRRFRHNCLTDCAKKLTDDAVIITEGIFSMSGQEAPLRALADLALTKQASILVDEAHAFGIRGSQGRGAVAEHGLTQIEVPLRMISMGKSMAGSGAIVGGNGLWIDLLNQIGRSNIYSTSLSPALVYGLRHALDLLIAADDKRKHLQALINFFQEQIAKSDLIWAKSSTPIQQLQLGCPQRSLEFFARLKALDISCFPMRQPTVNREHTGLRIVLNAHHTQADIQYLFAALEKIAHG